LVFIDAPRKFSRVADQKANIAYARDDAENTDYAEHAKPMMNKRPTDVQEPGEEPDARVERTMRAMGTAMAVLLAERSFKDITVQHILDRADVSRATFYAYWRNKDDALYWSFERMLAGLASRLDAPGADYTRLAPLAEMLHHLGDSGGVIQSLRDAGRLDEIWVYGTELMADMIGRRLPPLAQSAQITHAAMQPKLAARLLGAALIELAKWWVDNPDRETPEALDRQFHEMARRVWPAARATPGARSNGSA
jgi:AcrR family transcriptional regulator